MIGRIGYYQTHSNIRTAIHDQRSAATKLADQMSSQDRIQELRQDPVAAAHGSRYQSVLSRKETFVKQNRRIYDSLQLSEGYMRQMTELLQMSREIAVQGANGIYEAEDRQKLAIELNELMEEMLQVMNAKDSEGRYLFGGAKTDVLPFYAARTSLFSDQKDMIHSVEYLGSDSVSEVRISEQDLIGTSIPGSKLLWIGNQRIYSTGDASGFILQEDSVIYANGKEIALTEGDTLPVIMDKINNSEAAIRVSQTLLTGELTIEATNTEQIWLKDLNGTLLQDLGIINDNNAPYNISQQVESFDETIFGALIDLRNALFENNVDTVGGRALGAIDRSLSSVLENLGKVGAVSERLDIVHERVDAKDILNVTAQIQEELSVDYSDLILRWRDLLQVQQATYAITNEIMSTSLLDYLR